MSILNPIDERLGLARFLDDEQGQRVYLFDGHTYVVPNASSEAELLELTQASRKTAAIVNLGAVACLLVGQTTGKIGPFVVAVILGLVSLCSVFWSIQKKRALLGGWARSGSPEAAAAPTGDDDPGNDAGEQEATGADDDEAPEEEATGGDDDEAPEEEATGGDDDDAPEEEATGGDDGEAPEEEATGGDEAEAPEEEATGGDDGDSGDDDDDGGDDDDDDGGDDDGGDDDDDDD